MKVIVGLGNPGKEFERTRHNVGFRVVEKLAGEVPFELEKKFETEVARVGEWLLVKPMTFMNASGKAVSKLLNFYKIPLEELWVVHDDLDIRLGEYKIQQGKGPKIHYGVKDIEEKLGSGSFWRVRIGVDNRTVERRTPGDDYVLAKFKADEEKVVGEVIAKIIKEIKQ